MSHRRTACLFLPGSAPADPEWHRRTAGACSNPPADRAGRHNLRHQRDAAWRPPCCSNRPDRNSGSSAAELPGLAMTACPLAADSGSGMGAGTGSGGVDPSPRLPCRAAMRGAVEQPHGAVRPGEDDLEGRVPADARWQANASPLIGHSGRRRRRATRSARICPAKSRATSPSRSADIVRRVTIPVQHRA